MSLSFKGRHRVPIFVCVKHSHLTSKLMLITPGQIIYSVYRGTNMSRENTLKVWSQRPSDTEQDRIDRTERMVREAISHSPDYRVKNATVFAKGSVKMRTNIRKTSDIDLCVRASDV